MTDRELLEKAAKAAGLPVEWDGDGYVIASKFRGHLTNYDAWNPLTDDGDALRLAVKLGVDLVYDPEGARVYKGTGFWREAAEDRGAATRRAIVRAAAAISASTSPPEPA